MSLFRESAAYIQITWSVSGMEGRHHGVENLVYAGVRSMEGTAISFHERQPVNHPVSLYAARNQRADGPYLQPSLWFPATGLHTVGPWGVPTWLRCCLPARSWLATSCSTTVRRDFTYIDDIVEGLVRCCDKPATPSPDFDPLQPDPATAAVPHRVFNIGNSQPTELMRFIEVMEKAFDRKAIKDFQPMQPGDVVATAADTSALENWVGFKPSTSIVFGIEKFAEWFINY